MKKVVLLTVSVLICSVVFSQKIYRKSHWSVGETIKSGSPIKRIEGENSVRVVTNVGYQSSEQLLEELKEKKKQGKISGDKYKSQLNEYKNISKGGMVYLYVERPEAENSNTKNFKVKLTDKSGNVIQEKQMRTQDGKMNRDGSAYKNDGTVFVKTPIGSNFFIEVIEQTSEGEKTYKFEVVLPEK